MTNSNDVELTDIGNISMPATEVAGYVEITLDATKVEEMRNGTFANNGFGLSMGTESNDAHSFTTRDAVADKPELVINDAPSMLLVFDK